MDELRTRLVPWDQIEVTHARNRPHPERPPLPGLGDRVWYRRYDWDRDPVTGSRVPPVEATIIDVQDLDDRTDPNLWQEIRNLRGQPMRTVGGAPVHQVVADPWPWLHLRLDEVRKPDGGLMRYGEIVQTRESRMRGSAGWLPLDYLQRPERWRMPGDTALIVRPPMTPTPTRDGEVAA